MKYREEIILKAAEDAYKNGDVKFDIMTDSCALIVIDMQNEFVQPAWTTSWIPEATRQVPKIKKLIDHCRNKHVPVIYTAFKDTHLFRDRPKTGEIMPNRYIHLGLIQNGLRKAKYGMKLHHRIMK